MGKLGSLPYPAGNNRAEFAHLTDGARAFFALADGGALWRASTTPSQCVPGTASQANLDLWGWLGNNSHCCMAGKSTTKSKKPTRRVARDMDVKISFLEGLVNRDPAYVEALQMLGDHYTQRGRFQDGLRVDLQLSTLDPQNPLVFYNLACSYSLMDQFGNAAAALDKALALGYRDFKWLAKDPDLRQLRKHPVFRGIRDKIRKMRVRIS